MDGGDRVLSSRADEVIDDSTPWAVLYAALALRDIRPVVMVTAGSSTTAGVGASSAERRWVDRLSAAIHAGYPLASGGPQPAPVSLEHAVVEQTSSPGVRFVNAGVGGTRSDTYLTPSSRGRISALDPFVIFHMVGSNDIHDGVRASVYEKNMTAQLDALDAAVEVPHVHVLIQQHRRTQKSLAEWRAFGDALREVAASRTNALMLDVSPAFEAIGVPGSDPYGMLADDLVHLTDAGHAYLFDRIRQSLGVAGSGRVVDFGVSKLSAGR